MTTPVTPTKSTSRPINRYPLWAPRFWHGMALRDWWQLLRRNHFHVHPVRYVLVLTVTMAATFNSVMGWLQRQVYGKAIAQEDMNRELIFILGHWRSGTTLLHELMVLDDRFAYPTTYECFAANHFLLTGSWMPKLIWFLLPAKRPMDDMSVSFSHPQEDEFALISLGAPSPLLRLAFPNDPPPYMEFLNMEGAAQQDLAKWKELLRQFVAAQMHAKGKGLVLKSPTHTGRLQVLAEMFPNAKFIHITRDPYQLFSSTQRLWTVLDEAQSFQMPREEHLDEYVFTALERMYGGLERQRLAVSPERICDLRYEQLVTDPVGSLERVYSQLDLGDFSPMRPLIESSMQQRQSYKTNRHELPPEVVAEIGRRWAGYIQKYGYAKVDATPGPPI